MTLKTVAVLTATLFTIAPYLTGCASGPTSQMDTASITDTAIAGTSTTLVVHGMSCPLCANNVDKQLLAVRGVTSVDVDMGTGEVVVSLDPKAGVTTSQLAKAVSDSGFTLAEVRNP